MKKQDMQGVRSPTDIERKYDLAGIAKAVRNSEEGINKTNASLEKFVNATLQSFQDIENQLDGNVTTHFYKGIPTLDSVPAVDWTTEEERSNHAGDLYYDKDTGRVYEFVKEEELYHWKESESNAVIEAMALANSAKDTADGKRRVFVETPVPPYDNGDLWLMNREIYVCQISKEKTEAYVEGDFVLATKYTDDTVANQVGDTLTVLSGTVAKILESQDSFEIEFEKTVKTIDELKQETVEELKKTLYKFDTEDLTIEKSGSQIKTRINEDGMRVYKNDEEMLKANNEGVDAVNLHAKTYLIVGNNSRFEDYENADGETRTACFWVGK